MLPPSPAERIDAAVSELLAGRRPHTLAADQTAIAEVATLVQAALPPIPPGLAFEDRLAERLRDRGVVDALRRRAVAARRQLTPARLIAAGAVSSAAVGVTLAVWAGARRTAAPRAGWHR
ncbi:MAG TPA: hypothetical protein VFM74_02365 [Candidatus Limnocylindria bacterium]|nr:hypothetical protein [Candidatus Limnocylindria bacterium]